MNAARWTTDAPGSELSQGDILQGMVQERQVGIHALELGAHLLQLPHLGQMGHGHPRILALPLVVRGIADAMFAAGIADLGVELDFFEDGDDLRLTESGFLHAETSVRVDSLLLNGAKIRGGFKKEPKPSACANTRRSII